MKTALVVIYNHNYEKNISRIEDMYKGAFSHVYHVMPFYGGDKDNVIPVYESSFYFSGYVAQAYTHLRDKGFTHFFFVADDMVLNPALNERNYHEKMGIDVGDCYVDQIYDLLCETEWAHLVDVVDFRVDRSGVEVKNILPSASEARKRFDAHGIAYGPLPRRNAFKARIFRNPLRYLRKARMDYPLTGGYCDIFIVTAEAMRDFSTYCGAFAALKLFVEVALPTAMLLASERVRTIKDTNFKAGALWTADDKKILTGYGNNLSVLLQGFPTEYLYLHPIKLSQWT